MVFSKSDDHLISSQHKFLTIRPTDHRGKFMKALGNLNFEEFIVEVGVTQIGSFSREMGYGVIL